jgi:DNA primase
VELNSVKKYYSDLVSTPIEPVANNILGDKVTARSGATIMCDCPNHHSESRKSLHISTDKQSWYCFGCAVGGDVLHLVEFVKEGVVSHEASGTHRAARDWLANFNNMPTLSSLAIGKERQREGEGFRKQQNRTGKILHTIFSFYHAQLKNKKNDGALKYLKDNYAISDETAKRLLIGFVPEKYPTRIIESFFESKKITLRELISTGIFRAGPNDTILQSYPGRLLFPYWQKGQPRFAIARKTPYTPDNEFEQGKYKKLPIRDDQMHSHICETIDNRLLYNEDLLSSKPEKIIIVEGITDCIVLEQNGFFTISPVTVSISKKDWERIISKLRDVKTVYLCLDNEVSGVGLAGAQKACVFLGKHEIDARIITIPLSDLQRNSRDLLKKEFGIEGTVSAKEKRQLVNSLGDDKKKVNRLEELLQNAKTDPNEFFKNGGTKDDFAKAMAEAKSMMDFEIDKLSADLDGEELERLLSAAITQLAYVQPIGQERGLNRIYERLGGAFSKNVLRSQLTESKKSIKKKDSKDGTPTVDRLTAAIGDQDDKPKQSLSTETDGVSQSGSCLHAMREAEAESRALNKPFTPIILAEKIADWIESNGGKFFYYSTQESCLFFDNEIYNMDSSNKSERRKFRQFLYKITGMVDTTSDGRTVIETLANTAHKRGKLRKQLTWIHTDTKNKIIYFNLNNDSHEILKIDKNNVEFLKNGVNDDEILLSSSPKMKTINFDHSVDISDANDFVKNTIQKNMACSSEDAYIITSWLFCFLLLDFASTKPATRFEGDAASGKTTAARIITTLLFGEQQQKRSTDAANYHDGATNPLVCLDNIETKQMTDGLTQFLLTSVTGISNEKRQMGSDSGVISETTKCLVNTTGIEALMGELSEVQSRTLTINFGSRYHSEEAFVEIDLLDEIKNNRDMLLSAIIVCTQRVLKMLDAGAQKATMNSIMVAVGKHEKARCNDYLALMFLMNKNMNEIHSEDFSIDDNFKKALISIGATSKAIKADTNPIAQGFEMLLSAFECLDNSTSNASSDQAEIKFQLQYNKFDGEIENASAKQLHFAMSKIYKDAGMRWPYSNARVLAQRMVNDVETICEAGIVVEKKRVSKNHPATYSVKRSDSFKEAIKNNRASIEKEDLSGVFDDQQYDGDKNGF